ncbi:hypothetical protein FO519_009954, partial [Halicephalobus sp. NKZ332]
CQQAKCTTCIASAIQCNPEGSKCEYLGKCVDPNADAGSIDVCANSTCPTDHKCVAQLLVFPRIPRSAYKSVECKKNEVIIVCKECDVQCASLNKTCPDDCKATWSCGCDHGFARDLNSKKCIPTEQCPTTLSTTTSITPLIVNDQVCPQSETWFPCGGCEGTCDDPYPDCQTVCNPGKCACMDIDYLVHPCSAHKGKSASITPACA